MTHLTKPNPPQEIEFEPLPTGLTNRELAKEEANRDLTKPYPQLLTDAHDELLCKDRPPAENLLHAQKRIMALTARAAMSHDTASKDLISFAQSIHEATSNLTGIVESTHRVVEDLTQVAKKTDKASQSIVNLTKWLIAYTVVLVLLTLWLIYQEQKHHNEAHATMSVVHELTALKERLSANDAVIQEKNDELRDLRRNRDYLMQQLTTLSKPGVNRIHR